MSGPWEDYKQQEEGPWNDYQDTDIHLADKKSKDNSFVGQMFSGGNFPKQVPSAFTDMVKNAAKSALPLGGMAYGAAQGLTYGAPFGPVGAVAGPIIGAGLGYASGTALNKDIEQGVNLIKPGFSNQSSGEVARDIAGAFPTGMMYEAGGQILNKGVGMAANALSRATPRIFRQAFGVEEPLTKYVQKRGASNVLTRANRAPDSELNALEGAKNALFEARKTTGKSVGQAEQAILNSNESSRLFDASKVAAKIREELKRPVFDPIVNRYGGAASEKAALEKLATDLESGNISARQMIGLRKNLDKMVDWSPGNNLPRPSPDFERIIKNVNDNLRGTLNNSYPELRKANLAFQEAATVYNKFRKFLGGTSSEGADLMADANSVRRARAALAQGGIPKDSLQEFDNHIAQGQNLMQKFFDTIAANRFAGTAPAQLSPSSPILRGLSAVGAMGPRLGGAALKIGQAASGVGQAASPLTSPSIGYFYDQIKQRGNPGYGNTP